MPARNRNDVRRLLLDSALTTTLCYVSLVLAYAVYRSYVRDWLQEQVPRDTKDAIKSIFLTSTLVFGALFLLGRLAALRAASASRGLMLAGALVAYALATRVVLAEKGDPAIAVLTISWGLLGGFLLVYARLPRATAFFRARWRHLLLLSVSLFLSLEVGLRAYYLLTYRGTLEDLHDRPRLPTPGVEAKMGELIRPSLNHDIIYELKPGLEVLFLGASVKTSSRGWREQEIPLAKPPGTRRILGIGDSIMFGWGVEEGERYMDQLEAKLNAGFPQARWETIVTAVPGYNLMSEVELLERVGLAYDPDLIVYGFCGNDVRLPNFVQSRKRILSLESFTLFYLDVVRRRGRAVFATRIGDQPATEVQKKEDVPEEYRHLMGHDAFLAALRRLGDIGEKTGAPIIDFDFDYGAGARHGAHVPAPIRYFNARDAVASCGDAFALNERDQHPSATGHRALADALYGFLVESGVVAEVIGE